MIEAGSVAAFAADPDFVEGGVGKAVREMCMGECDWVFGRIGASGMAADAVVGDAAAEASGVIWFVAWCDIPAVVFGVPVNG